MKRYWHTNTLFIEWWKYKWSRKYDTCVCCKSPKKPHKWNWLCIACFDKQRAKKRKWALKRQTWKCYYKNRLLHILTTIKDPRKKPWVKPTGFNQKEYRKQWYQKNKEIMLLKWEVARRREKGLPCLKAFIKWKEMYFPFENIEKPDTLHSQNPKIWEEYEKWRINIEKYDLLYNWYNKWKKK